MADLIAAAIAVALAAILGLPVVSSAALRISREMIWVFPPLLVLGLWGLRLYPAATVSGAEELKRVTISATAAMVFSLFVLLGTGFGWNKAAELGLTWLCTSILVPFLRSVVRGLVDRRNWWGVPALLVGHGLGRNSLVPNIERHVCLDLKVLGRLADNAPGCGAQTPGIPVVGTLADAPCLQKLWRVRYGIVTVSGHDEQLPGDALRYELVFPRVIPAVCGRGQFGHARRAAPGAGLHWRGRKIRMAMKLQRVLKRTLDLLFVVPFALVAAPLVLVSAVAVLVVSPGNPFYSQKREGLNGRPIDVWKLRTMYKDADQQLASRLAADPESLKEWQEHFKLAKDPRVLPLVGPALRRSSLDELPQLWNVLLGQMSFVGPRPFPHYHLERFTPEFRRLRSSVVPGLTGYWQVTSRSTADVRAQEWLDRFYVENWSLWLDAYIVMRTPLAVFSGRGAS